MRLRAIIMKELRAVREDPSFHLAALVSPLLFLLAFSLMLSSGIVLPLATYPDAGESAFLQGVADYRAPDGTPYLSLSPAAADVPRSDAENDLLVVVQEPQLENGVLSGELIHYVNDVNENMTKNYRNRVDGAVRQTIDALRADGGVTVREHTRYAEDIPWDTGFGVSVLVFSLMLSGLLFGMLAMTSEWSDRTTTLLRLAPASPRLLICGKLLAGCLRRRGISGGVHADIRHAAGACAGFCRCTAACLRELSLPGDVPGTGYPLGADGIPDLAGVGAGTLGRRRWFWAAVVFRHGGEYPWRAQSGDVCDRAGALVLF